MLLVTALTWLRWRPARRQPPIALPRASGDEVATTAREVTGGFGRRSPHALLGTTADRIFLEHVEVVVPS